MTFVLEPEGNIQELRTTIFPLCRKETIDWDICLWVVFNTAPDVFTHPPRLVFNIARDDVFMHPSRLVFNTTLDVFTHLPRPVFNIAFFIDGNSVEILSNSFPFHEGQT